MSSIIRRVVNVFAPKKFITQMLGSTLISVLLRNETTKECLAQLVIKGGSSRNYTANLPEGTAHMLEHVLIGKIDKEKVKKYKINGYTTKSIVAITGVSSKKNLKNLLQILIGTLQMDASSAVIQSEKVRILKEMGQVQATGKQKAELLISRLYKGSPLEHTILGTPSTLDQITPSHLTQFLSHSSTTGNILLSVLGSHLPNTQLQLSLKNLHLHKNTLPSLTLPKPQASITSNKPDTPAPIKYTQCIAYHPNTETVQIAYQMPLVTTQKDMAKYLMFANTINTFAKNTQQQIEATVNFYRTGSVLLITTTPANHQNNRHTQLIEAAINTQPLLQTYQEITLLRNALDTQALIAYLFGLGIEWTSEKDLRNHFKQVTKQDLEQIFSHIKSCTATGTINAIE